MGAACHRGAQAGKCLMGEITVVNVGYRSTNYWVISAGNNRLLVDLGWPGGMGELQANLRRMDVPMAELRYGLATHYHIDHAGLGEELKRAGVPLLVIDVQADALHDMKRRTKPHDRYVEITEQGNVTISCRAERARCWQSWALPAKSCPHRVTPLQRLPAA